MENWVGFAVILSFITRSGGLPDAASINTAEMYTIEKFVEKKCYKYVQTDSQSALQAFKPQSKKYMLACVGSQGTQVS